MIIVSDSGPLIALAKLNLLFILQELFEEITIPEEVWKEVVERGKGKAGSELIEKARWIKVKEVEDDLSVEILCMDIERGEAETITLAKKLNADMLILDEKIPREIATALGLRVVGSLALIHNCIEKGIVNQTLTEITKKMRQRRIWISDEVIEEITKSGVKK
jgi:predicted nucleic acid-binding protein